MKKQITTLVLMALSFGALAQFEKGTMMVGGNVGFSTNSSKDKVGNTTRTSSTSTYFSLEPQFGYFIIDRLALGSGLELALSKYKVKNSEIEGSSTGIQISPFVRYYLQPGIFFEGQFGIGTSKNEGTTFDGSSYDSKQNVSSWSLAAGYAIMLNESVAIEPMIGYGSTIYKDPDEDGKSMYPGLFLRVGFQIYLR